jgi:hypothetical protein
MYTAYDMFAPYHRGGGELGGYRGPSGSQYQYQPAAVYVQ